MVLVDSTHVKACASSKKYHDEAATEQTQWYADERMEEIQKEREAYGKEPLEEQKSGGGGEGPEDPPEASGSGKPNKNTSRKKQARRKKEKHQKVSASGPESGWFRKGEHKHVFAYHVQTACDANGVIPGYSVDPGNGNDGKTFPTVLEKLSALPVEVIVGGTAYKTPAIAHLLKEKGIKLLSTYVRPKTGDGFFRKYEYVYGEYYVFYICPDNQVLNYSTTDREGYREYKSCGHVCAICPYPAQCTTARIMSNP